MSKKLQNLPEVFVSTRDTSLMVTRAMKAGLLRKLAPRIYTKNLKDTPETIIKRHQWLLVASLFPDALIADRTAIENTAAEDGSIFLISNKRREAQLPGLVIRPRIGARALDSDKPFIGGLKLSSLPRAYLENLRLSKSRQGKISRALSRQEIEERLESVLRLNGDEALNRLRDEARNISKKLKLSKEFKKLDEIIGGLLTTRKADLKSGLAKARAAGQPYDPGRIEIFTNLRFSLEKLFPANRPTKLKKQEHINLCFYDAYFSNFIEGTEFEVQEAADIIFNNKIPKERPADAHDIIGTYHIVSDNEEMQRLPKNFKEFIGLLKHRHKIMMGRRPEIMSGDFKEKNNQAGSTLFVQPELVMGTFEKGFEIYQGLTHPFTRAVYMMFLVSEVHPFRDGNGRIARVMMNAELVTANQFRIIIPTVYRINYMNALKSVTRGAEASSLIRVLDYAQKYTAAIDWSDYKRATLILEQSNAFYDPNEADSEGIKLEIPKMV